MTDDKLRDSGIKLIVEIELTREQFKSLLDMGLGSEASDAHVLNMAQICNRRILPSDSGSFGGVGHDVNSIVKSYLDGAGEPK